MYVHVDLGDDPAAVTLAEAADCTRFHVAVAGPADAARLDAALRVADAGGLDGDGEALVRVDAVRRLAAGAVGDSWGPDFDAMLDYARAKGWLSEDGSLIRAHVEWG